MNAIETHQVGPLTVSIFQDPEPCNPRDELEDDRLVTIACRNDHANYTFGDDDAQFDIGSIVDVYAFERADAIERGEDVGEPHRHWAAIVKERLIANGAIESTMVGLAVTDHSGLYLRVDVPDGSNAGDRWDTAFVGWAYMTTESIKTLPMTPADDVREMVVATAAAYGQYLCGDVYGYVVEGPDGETVDSCWGFYGLDDVRSEALDVAKGVESEMAAQRAVLVYRSQVDLDAALELARQEN
jgi:hypothetical protein